MATIEVPEDVLEQVIRVAHAATPQAAVLRALQEFADRHDQSKLIPLLGTFKTLMSQEEIERLREME